jgi:hypothetical protein
VTGILSTIAGGCLNCNVGCCSFIGGGCSNCNCTGNESVIVGGRLNRSCCFGFIGGGCANRSQNNYASIVGGQSNSASGVNSFIGGGCSNCAAASCSSVVGGLQNFATGTHSFVGGGLTNCATYGPSFIGGGRCNSGTGYLIAIGGGYRQCASGNRSFIGSGTQNTSSGCYSVIGGGRVHTSSGPFSGILGGICNNTNSCSESMIVGSCITSQLACATSVNKLIYYASATDTNYLTDPNVAGEIVFFGTFRETVAAGQLVVFTNNGTIGWHLADADTTTESTGLLGISLSARVDGNNNATGVLVRGFARSSTYYTTAGDSDILYVSNTPGGITDTAPTGSGDVVRIVGYMVDDTFDLIYFCPDTTWVQLV